MQCRRAGFNVSFSVGGGTQHAAMHVGCTRQLMQKWTSGAAQQPATVPGQQGDQHLQGVTGGQRRRHSGRVGTGHIKLSRTGVAQALSCAILSCKCPPHALPSKGHSSVPEDASRPQQAAAAGAQQRPLADVQTSNNLQPT